MNNQEKLTNEETRGYFDAIATMRGINAGSNSDKYGVIRDLLMGSATHEKVLECGGGGGFYTRRLLMDGYAVTCVDLSEKALQENSRQAEMLGLRDRLDLIHGDFTGNKNVSAGGYDQVVFIKVLHHFPSLDAIEEAIVAGLRACRPEGRVVIFEPNGANVLWKPFLSMVRDKESGRTKWYYEQNLRFTTQKNIATILKKQAADYDVRYHYVLPGFLLEKNFIGVGLLCALNRLLERSIFKKFAFNISFTIDQRS